MLSLADNIHEAYIVLNADLHEHLSQVRRGGGMYQRAMAFQTHGFNHAQCGERIDKA